jgi:hypothetical protein
VTELLATLAPIALLDGLSIVPLCIVPMAVLLGGGRPWLGAVAFILGIALPYAAVGIGVAAGLGSVFDAVGVWATRWLSAPTTLELLLQVIIGAVAAIAGVGMLRDGNRRPPGRQESVPPTPDVTPGGAFVFAAGMMVAGLPGALPYFAAIDQILRAEVGPTGQLAALAFYNLVIVLPLIGLGILRLLLADRSQRIFARLADLAGAWGPRIFAVLLILLGVVFVADGVGFLFGYPLLPVYEQVPPGSP